MATTVTNTSKRSDDFVRKLVEVADLIHKEPQLTITCKAKKCVHHDKGDGCELFRPHTGDTLHSLNERGVCNDFNSLDD